MAGSGSSRGWQHDNLRVHINGNCCTYCGETAEARDHFPPRSYTNLGWLLPVCNECNSALGNSNPTDFEARVRSVKDFLQKRYAKILNNPEWADEEIRELGYNIKKIVKGVEGARRVIKKRLDWDAASYIAVIDTEGHFLPVGEDRSYLTWTDAEFVERFGNDRKAARLPNGRRDAYAATSSPYARSASMAKKPKLVSVDDAVLIGRRGRRFS